MKDLNHVSVIGRLTKDAGFENGRLSFSIAFNTTKKEGDSWIDEVNYLNLMLFGKIAESLSNKLIKGTQVAITGHLKQNRWEKDGQKISALNVVVDEIQIVGGKKTESNESSFKPSPSASNTNQNKSQEFPEDDFMF